MFIFLFYLFFCTFVFYFKGVLAGIILRCTNIVDITKIMEQGFSNFFMIVLLPPILFDSAINMDKVI